MLYLTSDLHFCHSQPFIYAARGYNSVEEMNEDLIRKWNEVIGDNDEVWVLGDIMFNDNVNGVLCLSKLKGRYI